MYASPLYQPQIVHACPHARPLRFLLCALGCRTSLREAKWLHAPRMASQDELRGLQDSLRSWLKALHSWLARDTTR